MVSKTMRVVREKTTPGRASGNLGVRKKQIVNTAKEKKQKASTQGSGKKGKVLKIKNVEKEVRVKISIKNKVVGKKVEQSLADPAPRKLMVRSPFLFPLPREQAISALARYTGVFFVAVGSLFSLLNLYTINPVGFGANLASVSTLGSDTLDNSTLVHEPEPVVAIDGNSGELAGSVQVIVTVPYAEQVHLVTYSTDSSQNFALGYAERVDDTTWKRDWLTTAVPDGEYRVKVVVLNQFGTYTHVSDTSFIVRNSTSNTDVADYANSLDDTATVPPTTSSSTNQNTDTIRGITLHIRESNPVHDDVSLDVTVSDATSVSLHAKNMTTGALYFVGSAKKYDDTLWKYVWDSHKVPDGTYQLIAKAITPQGNLTSGEQKIIVGNEMEDTPDETSTSSGDKVEITTELHPDISLTLTEDSPASDFIEISVGVSDAQWVEVYALQQNSLAPFFLGLAKKITETEWKYLWQTTNSPNGEYSLYVRVKTQFGFVEGEKYSVTISNAVLESFTSEQEREIETLQDVADTLIKTTNDVDPEAGNDTAERYVEQNLVYVKSPTTFVSEIEVADDTKDDVLALLDEYRAQLQVKLNELARAKRLNDDIKVSLLKEEIEQLRNSTFQNLPPSLGKTEILDRISSYLSQITYELQEVTVKNEVTLLERVGDAIHKDTDGDDITDYDEVNLYKTNPFTADTDGDGYNDGVEIGMGYNPHESEGQALIGFESPQEVGVTREDILAVASVTNVTSDIGDGKANRALITGKGLPNSFVTLFIYSTPLIVTVKTDSDGGWSYILDKELEEGEHEIYAGITDNAGRIVAKSNPFPFVKTAEAYTGKTERQTEEVVANVESSLVQGNVMLLVASIAVSALGLVLILLGLHVTGGRKQEMQPALQ